MNGILYLLCVTLSCSHFIPIVCHYMFCTMVCVCVCVCVCVPRKVEWNSSRMTCTSALPHLAPTYVYTVCLS